MNTKRFAKYGIGILSIMAVLVLMLAACTSSPASTPTTTPTSTPAPTSTPQPVPPALITPNPSPSITDTVPAPTPTPTLTPEPSQYSVTIADSDEYGEYLVDGEGMTLYYYAKDTEGMSNVTGALLANWPVFYADNFTVPSTFLMASDFGAITREDGTMQMTFMGWPLYTFIKDMAPGDINGQGLIDSWFVVSPNDFIPPKVYSLVSGWYNGEQIKYYDFGANTPLVEGEIPTDKVVTAPIYAFITGKDASGNPQFLSGQHNIVDVIPTDDGYSDLWNVILVTVPSNYVADTFTSADNVTASGYPLEFTETLLNCPIVPPGSTTETDLPLTQGWYKGQNVFYFNFGPNPDTTAPIYVPITGTDAEGKPVLVPGQHNIIGVVPGDENYSAFWQVNQVEVPTGYTADALKSVDDVESSGYPIALTDLVVNCPVIDYGATSNSTAP